MNREQEIRIGELAMEGYLKARNFLIESNMGLVVSEVSKMTASWHDREDYMQAGYEGLIEAAQSYDPDKGSFATYARKFIKGHIAREYRKNGIAASYSTKCHAAECMRRLDEIQRVYGILDDSKSAAILGISKNTLDLYRQLNEHTHMSSLDQLIYDSEMTLMDTISYEDDLSFEDEMLRIAIQKVLQSLSTKQREIVMVYFGFTDGRQHSFKETAKECNVKEVYIKRQMPLIFDRIRKGLTEYYKEWR